jgi:type I restriction enzyme S subunit
MTEAHAWPLTRFGDIAEFRNGLNFLASESGTVVPMLGVADFKGRESIGEDHNFAVVTPAREMRPDDFLSPGDLVFVRSNGSKSLVGRCLIYTGPGMKAAISGFTIRARVVSHSADPTYLSKVMQSPLFRAHLLEQGGGSSINNLSQTALAAFKFHLPPLPEQRKIAEILRAWDNAIELVEAQVSRLQTRRCWLRLEVLTGRVRMGDHTEQWSKTPLSEVLREHKQRSSGSEEVFSVSVHKGLVNQTEHLGRSFAAVNTDHYNLVNAGDVVYTKSPTGDFPFGIIKRSSAPEPVIVSPLYGVFTPRNPDLGVILDAYFESPRNVRNYLSPLVQKGAKNTIAINNQRFLSGHLNLPDNPAEQGDLAALLTVSQEEIAAGQRKAELLRAQKRGLMQKLLTGQVRVNVTAETNPGGHEDD